MYQEKRSMLRAASVAVAGALVTGVMAGCTAQPAAEETSAPASAAQADQAVNRLTPQEQSEGWRLLFDGQTTTGWRNAHGDSFPEKGWEIRNGELIVLESGGGEAAHGGDIVTVDQYADFDFRVDFKLSAGANSGIKYNVTEKLGTPGRGSAIGLEYQLLDDSKHPDANQGAAGTRKLGALYDLMPVPDDKPFNGIGEWNTARIVSRGQQVEHWLNGVKILEYERGSEDFRRRVAESKYKIYPGFGEAASGHILLQDHGNTVSFRNIKIKGEPVAPST
jgi:hypothetical protein